jgi:outer membrane immunogenic protein
MKKISLLMLMLSTATVLLAQQPVLRTKMAIKPRFGIKAGVNVANFKTESGFYGTARTKSSFNAGVYSNIPLGTGGFAFQPELGYVKGGSEINVTTSSVGAYDFDQHLDYLTVPLMFQYKIPKGFYLEAGPQLGFLVDSRIKESSKPSFRPNGRNKDWYDKFDLSADYGIGYMSRIGLGVSVRYTMGLSDAIADEAPTYITGKARNTAWQFGLTYSFGAYK